MRENRPELDHVSNYSKTAPICLPSRLPFVVDEKAIKKAAVLVALFYGDDDKWHVLLTKRASTLSTHPGEVSLPGGKCDPTDVSMEDTALREAWEEIGLQRSEVNLIGRIEPVLTRFWTCVYPVIGVIKAGVTKFLKGNPSEVSQIFTAPLENFLSKDNFSYFDYTRPSDPGYSLRYYEFRHGEFRIQGITSAICVKVATLIYSREPPFSFEYPFHIIHTSHHKL